jgi:hypothetical protein
VILDPTACAWTRACRRTCSPRAPRRLFQYRSITQIASFSPPMGRGEPDWGAGFGITLGTGFRPATCLAARRKGGQLNGSWWLCVEFLSRRGLLRGAAVPPFVFACPDPGDGCRAPASAW